MDACESCLTIDAAIVKRGWSTSSKTATRSSRCHLRTIRRAWQPAHHLTQARASFGKARAARSKRSLRS